MIYPLLNKEDTSNISDTSTNTSDTICEYPLERCNGNPRWNLVCFSDQLGLFLCSKTGNIVKCSDTKLDWYDKLGIKFIHFLNQKLYTNEKMQGQSIYKKEATPTPFTHPPLNSSDVFWLAVEAISNLKFQFFFWTEL